MESEWLNTVEAQQGFATSLQESIGKIENEIFQKEEEIVCLKKKLLLKVRVLNSFRNNVEQQNLEHLKYVLENSKKKV